MCACFCTCSLDYVHHYHYHSHYHSLYHECDGAKKDGGLGLSVKVGLDQVAPSKKAASFPLSQGGMLE